MTAYPPGTRLTAYAFSAARGLPCDLAALADLGLAAARRARWLGIPEFRVPEGPPGNPFIVHTWPEYVFEYVTAWQAQADAEAWGGQPPSASYQAWREGGGDGCDTGDRRCLGCGRLLPHGMEFCLSCDESLEVLPPWCPLPQGDQALRDIGF